MSRTNKEKSIRNNRRFQRELKRALDIEEIMNLILSKPKEEEQVIDNIENLEAEEKKAA
jgi:hypothetical protein